MTTRLLSIILFSVNYLFILTTSYAETTPECYIKMRGLDLTVNSQQKKVCQPQKIEPAQPEPEQALSASEKSHLEMETYFVRPNIENKENIPQPDGVGVGFSMDY